MRFTTARGCALALSVALALLAGCGKSPEKSGPERGAASNSGPKVYLAQEIMVVAGGPPVRYTHLVLLPGGVAVWGLPAGGPDGVDLEALRADRPDLLGTYAIEGDALRVSWPQEESPDQREWVLRAEGAGWRRSPARLYEPTSPVGAARLDGGWAADESMSVNLAGDATTIVSRTSRFTFHPDGRFERGSAAGVSHTESGSPYEGGSETDESGVAGHGAASEQGTYEIRGYTLTLRPDGGEARRHTLYRWPGAEESLGIDGRRFEPE